MAIRGTTSVDEDEENTSYVYAHSPKSDLVWINFEGTVCYYATTEKVKNLKKYITGESADFRIEKDGYVAPISLEVLQYLIQKTDSADADRISVNVSSLASVPRMEILMRDKTGTLSYVYATIYYMNGHYYFVNFSTLSNNYFDADGNFSYRNGTIILVMLRGDAQTVVTDAEAAMTYRSVEYSYEDPVMGGVIEEPTVFWVFLIIFGFLAPLILLILGLVLPHSSKRGYPKYWYRLTICAGVWLALSIAITVILIILQS